MNKTNERDTPFEVYNRAPTLDESINILNRQEQEICRLKSDLNSVKHERDLLIIEVSKLKFELEIADDLKKLYGVRSDKGRGLSNCLNGSINDSRDCHNDCDDDDDINGDIDDMPEDLNDNYKANNITDPYQYQWHRTSSNNNSIRNNSSEMVNYSRSVMNYELSQDLLDKQIELLERKYGGTRARRAAIVIQRAFRRYTLIKKFTHITEMVKAEKGGLGRRFQTIGAGGGGGSGGGGSSSSGSAGAAAVMAAANGGVQNTVHEYAVCELKNTSGGVGGAVNSSGPCVVPVNLTPIRSMSMREKRLAELENGTNSLPRSYAGRCTSCTYCSAVVSACSPCCLSSQQPMNMCPSYYIKQNHSGSIEVRNVQTHLPNCSSTSPVAYISYQTQNSHKKYSGQYIYHSPSQYQMTTPSPQLSTPKKVPPEVPKRTSSISFKSNDGSQGLLTHSEIGISQTNYGGSMSSVQSSSSDSSSTVNASHSPSLNASNYSSSSGLSWNKKPQVTETIRKRQYRVGLNLFNKKPEKGIAYLVRKGFLDDTPQAVAKFLIARKGLSKEMIGEYLGNIRNPFNTAVLGHYVHEIDLSGMQIDVALRKYQTYFKMPGEAQKIERLMEAFSERYCRCNRDVVSRFRSSDTVLILAFAIIMLNTDLHNKNMKDEKRMKLEEFIKNSSDAVDYDIDRDMLVGIYERVKANEFKAGSDHVSQVMKVQSTIVGAKLNLALPHRRLVCYCRLYEVPDVNKKDKQGVHQREVFLFNDLLVITKILSKKKNSVTYTFRQSFSLSGLHISVFQTQYYQFGIQLSQRVDNQVLISFNARNDHDRTKFVEDIRESIMEMDEMENLRIEAELERQKSSRTNRCNTGNSTDNRDSGVADVEVCQCLHACPQSATNCEHDGAAKIHSVNESLTNLKRSALSNSLLDIHDQDERPQRSGSVGSLDSGMSISFRSTSSLSRRHPHAVAGTATGFVKTPSNVSTAAASAARNQAFLASFFTKNTSKNATNR